ncbi:uncharacterized protein LOC131801717 isoform X2 [Musca domestica]|uniref:Uncharacterized protein LOC131801717 isoform X2 n=1 Tax=Musca domestica TaxID=7370 RepID=A0ABM3USZ2_MUSDO|nr:uncharacterized protein LOC131801717 isoform X2 [Musca domestica]
MIEYNLKFVSLAAAYFNLIVALIGIGISIGEVSEIAKSQFKDKKCYWMVGFHSCLFLYSIMLISVSVTLVIGIKKNELKVLTPFVFFTMSIYFVHGFLIIVNFISGLILLTFVSPYLILLLFVSIVVLQVQILWPMWNLYRHRNSESETPISSTIYLQ